MPKPNKTHPTTRSKYWTDHPLRRSSSVVRQLLTNGKINANASRTAASKANAYSAHSPSEKGEMINFSSYRDV